MKAARSLLISCRNAIRGRWLFVLLLLAVALGIALGIVLNKRVSECNNFTRKQWEMFIGFPGELFMRMLMLLVLPLISSSIIMSLTSIDKKTAGKLGKRAALFCLFTTLVASIMAGVVARVMIRPSRQNNFAVNGEEEKRDEALSASPVYSILDMIRYNIYIHILWLARVIKSFRDAKRLPYRSLHQSKSDFACKVSNHIELKFIFERDNTVFIGVESGL